MGEKNKKNAKKMQKNRTKNNRKNKMKKSLSIIPKKIPHRPQILNPPLNKLIKLDKIM